MQEPVAGKNTKRLWVLLLQPGNIRRSQEGIVPLVRLFVFPIEQWIDEDDQQLDGQTPQQRGAQELSTPRAGETAIGTLAHRCQQNAVYNHKYEQPDCCRFQDNRTIWLALGCLR